MNSCAALFAQPSFHRYCQHADLRQTFLSRKNQDYLCLFERRLQMAATTSSIAALPARRRWSTAASSPLKRLPRLPIKAFQVESSWWTRPDLSNPFLSRFVRRSVKFAGLDILQLEKPSVSTLRLQESEIFNSYLFLADIINNITAIDLLSFAFVSGVLGTMAAYIIHEVKHGGTDDSSSEPVRNPQINLGSDNCYERIAEECLAEASNKWLIISRSSQFNRSVSARCPSLSSSAGYKFLQYTLGGRQDSLKNPEYQRRCLPACDGGTVALDWPSHLDLDGNKELETILLLICGTTEGSNENGIGVFSQLVEMHGYFPIILNPRGCGGSPLTTPRTFSGADSDDVRLAAHFIARMRPWATILGIGWGCGANMLTKYLGEEASATPLAAAVCIDNPCNLYVATKPISGSRWLDFDHAMTTGLVQILDSNKMLFQGKKGFDITGALAATSLRDFDSGISRVVHGYDNVEAFYRNTSCEASLAKIQIPVLFIQHIEDYREPQIALPYHLFESNAYTMLLVSLCDPKLYQPSSPGENVPGTASEWTYAISLEWLTAVEISLLKGRHPLLSNLESSLKVPKMWSSVENQRTGVSLPKEDQKSSSAAPVSSPENYNCMEAALTEVDEQTCNFSEPSFFNAEGLAMGAIEQKQKSKGDIPGAFKLPAEQSPEHANISDNVDKGKAVEELPSGEELNTSEEADRGQVVKVAETAMKVLDVTMPGILSDAKKQQVLEAVGKGETLVTALEDAVPEDVRGKMSAAISEAVQAQGYSLKVAGLGKSIPAPRLSGVTESIKEKLAQFTGNKEGPSSGQNISVSSENKGIHDTQESDNVTTHDSSGDVGGKRGKKEKSGVDCGLKISEKEMSKSSSQEEVSSVSPQQGEPLFKDAEDFARQPETFDSKAGASQERVGNGSQFSEKEKSRPKSYEKENSMFPQNGHPTSTNITDGGSEPKFQYNEDGGSQEAIDVKLANVEIMKDKAPGKVNKNEKQEQLLGTVGMAAGGGEGGATWGGSEVHNIDEAQLKNNGVDFKKKQSSPDLRPENKKGSKDPADSEDVILRNDGEKNDEHSSVIESKGEGEKNDEHSNVIESNGQKNVSCNQEGGEDRLEREAPRTEISAAAPNPLHQNPPKSPSGAPSTETSAPALSPPPGAQIPDAPKTETSAAALSPLPPSAQMPDPPKTETSAAALSPPLPSALPEAPKTEPSGAPPSTLHQSPQTCQSDAPSAETSAAALSPLLPSAQIPDAPKTETLASTPIPDPQTSQNEAPGPEALTATLSPPQFPSMGSALQALTGFDDSTQMAVTNVFSVVENVLDQLENGRPSNDHGGHIATKQTPQDLYESWPMTKEIGAEISNQSEHNVPDSSHVLGKNEKDEGFEDEHCSLVKGHEMSMTESPIKEGFNKSLISRSLESDKPKVLQPSGKDRLNFIENSSDATSDRIGLKPFLKKNAHGYIKVDSNRGQLETSRNCRECEVKDCQPSLRPTPCLADNSSDPSQNSVSSLESKEYSSSPAESTSEMRLQVISAEIDAEDEERVDSLVAEQASVEGERSTNSRSDNSSVVADTLVNALKLEVVRRLGGAGLEVLGVDLEQEVAKVALAVSKTVAMGKDKLLGKVSHGLTSHKGTVSKMGGLPGVLNGKNIVSSLDSVLGSNSPIVSLVAFGVLVGVVMAALGAVYLIVSNNQDKESAQGKSSSSQTKTQTSASSAQQGGLRPTLSAKETVAELSETSVELKFSDGLWQDENANVKHNMAIDADQEQSKFKGHVDVSDSENFRGIEETSAEEYAESQGQQQGQWMGAMAAAMGATAAMASQSQESTAVMNSQCQSSDPEANVHGKPDLVPEFAERAISMVSPVMPRKEDGEVDHERLVTMLTEVGQKGGPLTLVGKAALLWGGLQGAMSLVERLLAFFSMGERPLQQRLVGFGGMVLLLWSPVLVPLLPSLLQQWTTKSPSGVADAAAGMGLYGAVFILITIWGRRVRGYDQPLAAYGLQLLSSAKLRLLAVGMAVGMGLVSGYYAVNCALGYAQPTWGAIVVTNPTFPGALTSTVLTIWKVVTLVSQCLMMASAVALVEEVVFRAWLLEEIAVDLGYPSAVLLSALAFAIVHWSPAAVVGLWFLGVALAGARARTHGDLSFPIGIHAGIVSSFSVMNLGGLFHYLSDGPAWFTGAHAGNPLAGALGTGLAAVLAIALYPRRQDGSPEEGSSCEAGS